MRRCMVLLAVLLAVVLSVPGCGSDSASRPAPSALSSDYPSATADFSTPGPQVQVYRVVRDLPQGLSAEDAFVGGYLALASIPEEFRPATAVDSLDQIKGMTAVARFAVGQVVVIGMFAPAGVPACVAQNLPCPTS